jgi:hypothetical protein
MTKFYATIILLFVGISAHAQSSRVISGLVMNKNYQIFVPNYPVTVIDSSTTGGVATYNYQTNASGRFTDTITTQGQTGQLWFTTPDSCGTAGVVLGYSTNTPFVMATGGLVLCNKIIQTNIGFDELRKPSIAAYPNPSAEELFINLNGLVPIDCGLIDNLGREHKVILSESGELYVLKIGHFPQGLYNLFIRTTEGNFVLPILKN